MAPALHRRGIATTLGILLALLIAYQGLIWARLMPRNLGTSQWENNIVRIEQYAYGRSERPIVLAGSSRAHGVVSLSGWREVVDLGMSGGASQTGLEVLLRTPGPPGVVVVELNDTITVGRDAKVLDSIFHPQLYALRGALPALRTEYRPVGIAVRLILSAQSRISQRLAPPAAPAAPATTGRPTQRDESVARAAAILSEPLTAEQEQQIRGEAALIRAQIAALTQAGWRVILCDIPRDSRLAETVQERQLKALLQELFPPDAYEWLATPAGREWVTNDGSHLVRSNAEAFAAILKQAVAPLAAAPSAP